MELNHIVDFLLKSGDSASSHLRAIRLFEFQIAVFHPRSFGLLVAKGNDATAPSDRLKTARIFAATKFLEKIDTDLKQEKNVDAISIQELAKNEVFRSVYDGVIATNGGWRRIRQSMKEREFDDNIAVRCAEALAVANVVDFSYRFSIHRANDRHRRGGVSTALYVVRKATSYKTSVHESTMKNRWREYKVPAIFLYLMLLQSFDLVPPRVSSSTFAATLLRQADDLDNLRSFFRAYQVVRESLSGPGYAVLPKLNVDLGCEAPQLKALEFSSDVQAAFEK
jgi:hypothetical protein